MAEKETVTITVSEVMTILRLLSLVVGKHKENKGYKKELEIFWSLRETLRKIVRIAASIQSSAEVKILPHPAVIDTIEGDKRCSLQFDDAFRLILACVQILSIIQDRRARGTLTQALEERGKLDKNKLN